MRLSQNQQRECKVENTGVFVIGNKKKERKGTAPLRSPQQHNLPGLNLITHRSSLIAHRSSSPADYHSQSSTCFTKKSCTKKSFFIILPFTQSEVPPPV